MDTFEIDTSKILFVGAGAFQELFEKEKQILEEANRKIEKLQSYIDQF